MQPNVRMWPNIRLKIDNQLHNIIVIVLSGKWLWIRINNSNRDPRCLDTNSKHISLRWVSIKKGDYRLKGQNYSKKTQNKLLQQHMIDTPDMILKM